MMKKLYFKVFADRFSTGKGASYYIDTVENCLDLCKIENMFNQDSPYIFEPVYMNEDEFDKLPEFQGF
jgi:hypothetical protein